MSLARWFRTPQGIPRYAAHWEVALCFECPANAVTALFVATAEWAREFAQSTHGCILLEEEHGGVHRVALAGDAEVITILMSPPFLHERSKSIAALECEIKNECTRRCKAEPPERRRIAPIPREVMCAPTRDDFIRTATTTVFYEELWAMDPSAQRFYIWQTIPASTRRGRELCITIAVVDWMHENSQQCAPIPVKPWTDCQTGVVHVGLHIDNLADMESRFSPDVLSDRGYAVLKKKVLETFYGSIGATAIMGAAGLTEPVLVQRLFWMVCADQKLPRQTPTLLSDAADLLVDDLWDWAHDMCE